MKFDFLNVLAILVLMFCINIINAQSADGFTWQNAESVDFGAGANHITIEAASAGLGGELELRLDAADGQVIGRAFFHHTGSPNYFLPYECELTQTVSGTHDVYMNFQDYSDPVSGSLLNIGDFQFSRVDEPPVADGDSLHIYPPVPGLDPSPYYEIYVQKLSALNSGSLANITNWETPFAWFTQCPDYATDGDNKGYYSNFIGGWSNTYTNFELDPNTPIVVKIVRKDDTGDDAPAGPIDTAVIRPANCVDSWEIIDGDVYVTMSQPALFAVDIDGQMETRVSPRATPGGWNAEAFPYRSKKEGAHSVTIFANPFIKDKPKPGDPGVLVVKVGEKIPGTQELLNENWDILYFEPGVHRASVDVDSEGNLVERRWQANDPITFQDNKSYYIPGDAIVYANFTDINRSNNMSENIRIYGHGTVSGSKINHNKVEGEEYSNDGWWTRALYLRDAKNCHYEGITAIDPAFHTLCIISTVKNTYEPNTIKWTKVLAWRTNSDGTAVGGNVQMEDCFIRCQDDGHYIGGTTLMRDVVFWHDVNGQTFRGDFTNRRYSDDNAPNIPKQIIYEDIDVIYARGVFATSNSSGFSIFGVGGGVNNETLEGGVENTGQMVYFRNINISDPLPCRKLISFDVEDKVGDYAGIRFANINYQGRQVFGWKNWLVGSNNGAIRNFVFDNVTIDGQAVDQKFVN
ncbi:MAG: carbohydrate-binding protein, partial [Bacteroidales bacterium]